MMDKTSESKKNRIQVKQSLENKQKSVFYSALGMALGTLGSRILGFVRDMALVGLFPKIVTDCFVLGFRVPNFFRRVLGEGALSVSFIPRYLELQGQNPEEALKLRKVMFTFLTCFAGLLTFFGILFMEDLINFLLLISSNKGNSYFVGEKFYLAVRMGQWMFGYLFLVTQFAYLMSVLNAHKKFWVAGFAPAFFNIGFLICIFIPSRLVSFTGKQLALGVLLGGGLQASIVGWHYFQNFGFPSFSLSFNQKPFLKVLRATLPSIFGIGVLQVISIINISLCASVGKGSLTYLYLADRILELPQSLIAVSIGTAMLPNLSELWGRNRSKFDETLTKSLRLYLFLSLPSALGIFFLSLPISQILFQRGATGFEDVKVVASLVEVYAFLLLVSGLSRIILPIYYSFKNTWYPACCAVVVVIIHYFVGQLFVDAFGLRGVVWTTLVSGILNFSLLIIGMKVFINRSYFSGLLKDLLCFAPACFILGGFLFLIQSKLPTEKGLDLFVMTIGLIGASAIIYFGISGLFKIEESKLVSNLLRKVIRK